MEITHCAKGEVIHPGTHRSARKGTLRSSTALNTGKYQSIDHNEIPDIINCEGNAGKCQALTPATAPYTAEGDK